MAVNASHPVAPPTAVTGALREAAHTTGASFAYLLATAKVESGFNPGAQAPTSSAGGLFQFIEQTWLGMLKEAGPAYGYGRYANAIVRSGDGTFSVPNPQMRREILALRHDATASSVMAGAFTNHNGAFLKARLGREATHAELYMAHFLGAGGASRLITLAGANPEAEAARAFPRAASANRSIFYDRRGNARSAAEVYGVLAGRYDYAQRQYAVTRAAAQPASAPAVAHVPTPRGRPAAPIPVRDTAATTVALAQSQPANAGPQLAGPAFHNLFHTGERAEPVAPLVRALWTEGFKPVRHETEPPPPSGAVRARGPSSVFDLIGEKRPDMRHLFTDRA